MSREAFPQLPPNSLAHIENFPPELHSSTQEKLLALSHLALHSTDDFGEVPIPQSELGGEHQPHIDSVAQHMDRASRMLSFAYSELDAGGVDGHGVSSEMLAQKAKEIAIQSAKEAKQAGDTGTAIKILESLLVIESLGYPAEYIDSEEQQKSTARVLVAEGLADELVEATHETFGLVAIETEYSIPVPLNAIARSSPQLLRVATSRDFSDDFSKLGNGEPESDISGLDCGDLLALSKLAQTEQAEASTGQDLLRQALKNATAKGAEVEPEVLAETLVEASRLSLNDEIAAALPDLRSRRRAGNGEYRINDTSTILLDKVVVKLVQKGEIEIAKGLISSSPQESINLNRAIDREIVDIDQRSEVESVVEGLCQEKQTELRDSLQSLGVNESIIDWVISTTYDPDSAASIPAEFWQKIEKSYSLRELFATGGTDLVRSATALSAIDASGLAEHSPLLFKNVIKLGDSERASAYLASVKGAIDILNSQQGSEERQSIDIHRVLTELVTFEDPIAALEAAKTLYGADYLHELHSLHGMVSPQQNNEIATFRPEDIPALAILRDYCIEAGIDVRIMNSVSKTLLENDEPISRAKIVAEGLQIAGIYDHILFLKMAFREDPISLGRAISIIEPQLTDTNESTHNGVKRRVIDSRNPEETALLIVRTQKELQKQQLTLDEVGDIGLQEAMQIVEYSVDSKAIEKFCSIWKIRLECKEAYQRYLQPVRESGDPETVDVEQKPKLLAGFVETKAYLEHLGVAPELVESMLDSWLSYSALDHNRYGEEGSRSEVTAAYVDMAVNDQSQFLVRQTEAFSDYVERFGIEETIAITSTFGIYNFVRYKPEQLHNQLLSWQSGELPTKNVVVGARYDWNGALINSGEIVRKALGEDGMFRFEVNDSTELAKVAVSIGNRERSMGREPGEINALENFIIDGHANPYGIRLGTHGQRLSTSGYLLHPLKKQRANTYQRHLGSKFRVILKACSTAGEVEHGMNIAEAISDHHDVRVEGSKVSTYGDIEISSDGRVWFNKRKVQAETYE